MSPRYCTSESMLDFIDANDVFTSLNVTNSMEHNPSAKSELVTIFPEFYFSDITPCSPLKVNRLQVSMYQKIEFLITIAVRTSNPTGYFPILTDEKQDTNSGAYECFLMCSICNRNQTIYNKSLDIWTMPREMWIHSTFSFSNLVYLGLYYIHLCNDITFVLTVRDLWGIYRGKHPRRIER
jgi:hypothetical protein